MATEFLVKSEDILELHGKSRVPRELLAQASTIDDVEYLIVGTRFANGKTYLVVETYDSDPEGFWETAHISEEDISTLERSCKPFFLKYGNSPIKFFDKPSRFSWHTATREFWESLPQSTEVVSNSILQNINTLGDLFNELYGPNSTMEVMENTREGTYSTAFFN